MCVCVCVCSHILLSTSELEGLFLLYIELFKSNSEHKKFKAAIMSFFEISVRIGRVVQRDFDLLTHRLRVL